MPLSVGKKLGPYEILAPIGAGGMGDVYKARDTRLDRIVAIKVSKTEFSERFEREAKAIAALNHSNICTLHDVGPNYLVMEYVEGAPLKGPLPLDQALKYAVQICDALDAAHKKGITHRDLKPANILVTKTGVKLLDFGLAKLASANSGPSLKPDDATLTMALTGKNEIVGTLYYMSPEQLQAQASGQEIDSRSDIFSFGIVLYEMLTGKRAFEGSSPASVIAAIMERPAPSVADIAPPALDRVLRKCLAKDPDNRWQSARDLKDELDWIDNVPEPGGVAVERVAHGRPLRWMIAAVVLAIVAVGLGVVAYRTSRPAGEQRMLKLSVLPPEKASLIGDIPAVSPDGHQVAFSAALDGKTSLWVRDLGSLEARALPGTEEARLPFWSPDSRFLGFFANGKLKKTAAAGGPVVNLCDAPSGRGGTWNQNDVILFAAAILSPIFRIPAAGGTPVPVTTLNEQETGHRYPWFLPDGHHFLYAAYGTSREKDTVFVADLDSKDRRMLLLTASNAVYSAPGLLLFLRELTLMAQPFDAGKLQTTGEAVPVAEHIGYNGLDIRAFFSASPSGVLVYDSPTTDASNITFNAQLTWFDRSGKVTGTAGAPGGLAEATISHDGKSVAYTRRDPQSGLFDVWLHDLVRGTDSRLTFNGQNSLLPVWSPDDSRIAFYSTPGGAAGGVYQRSANGAGQDEMLDKLTAIRVPLDWSRDGRYIIERTAGDAQAASNIWVLPLSSEQGGGDKKPYSYLKSDAEHSLAKLSPNGQWLAYQSNETKRNEIYVTTFPQPSGKWQVSANGGSAPVWSRDGKELFYVGADGKLMAVAVNTGAKFDAGVPKPLFEIHTGVNVFGIAFDVASDGRFLIPVPVEQSGTTPITVVLNWTAGLKK